MSNECSWLHEKLELLPLFKFPFNLKELPNNGIIFCLSFKLYSSKVRTLYI